MTDHPPDRADTENADIDVPATRSAESDADEPQPAVRPDGAKRRRTADATVARPAPDNEDADSHEDTADDTTKGTADGDNEDPAADDADDGDEFDDIPEPRNNPWADKLRRFLDSNAGKTTLIVTAIGAPILASPLAIYSVFAVTYLWRERLQGIVSRLPFGPRTTLALLIIVAGLLRESLTWVLEYIENDEFTLLWRPQLLPTLLISLGLYGAWAIGWSTALWWHRYRLGEALLVQAIFGLIADRLGQTMLAGMATMPFGIVLWLYAMLVSASTLGVAWLLAGDKLPRLSERYTEGAFRYAAPALLTGVGIILIFLVWGPLLGYFDALPDPAPIRERPFW